MKWNLDKSKPICPQLCEQICVEIANGKIAPESKLFSVREVALEAGVNPNTVQKSFEELERQGMIYSVRGAGWFVKEGIDKAKQIVEKIIKEKTEQYLIEMKQLGLDADSIKQLIEECGK